MPLIAQTLREIGRLLAPRPGRYAFAARLALICALTVLVTEIYQTPEPALTAYVVFFLNHEDRMTSLIMNVALVVVITFVIGLVLIVASFVADDPMWRFISIAALSFGLLFLSSASKLRPIGSTLALIVGYALDQLGTIQLGEEATRGYLYAWLFVGIPAGVSAFVNLLLAPSPCRLATEALATRLECSAAMLRSPDERRRDHFTGCLREGVAEIQKLLGLAGREGTSRAADIAALRQAAYSTVPLLSAIDVADRHAALPVPERDYIAQLLDGMAAILRTGAYPVGIAWEPPAPEVPPTPLATDILADIKDAIVRFAEPSPDPAPIAVAASEPRGFFEADAFTNPDHVHYALKTTGAAMFCYMLYSLLDWPGIHTAFLTCYIVSLGTTAETTEKLTLRILGCLIGAAAGIAAIIFLVPYLTTITELMIVVFIGAFASAYVTGGGPRISYAGFQIAFAFFLCVVQGAAPAFDMEIARDRVIGIVIGNLVVYLLFTNLWPVSVARRIDPAIASLLRRLSEMMRAADPRSRRVLASEARSALAAIETDIDLARYEPATLRPSQPWLAARRNTAQNISDLESPLFLTADTDTPHATLVADRLSALADGFAAAGFGAVHSEETPLPAPAMPLSGIVDAGLQRLEAAG